MSEVPSFAALKERLYEKRERGQLPESLWQRLRRSISWGGRAEASFAEKDPDIRFILLWIAFNAAYANKADPPLPSSAKTRGETKERRILIRGETKERRLLRNYFAKVAALDGRQQIHEAIWQRYPGPVRLLMENHYVYAPFWRYQNGDAAFVDWERSFKGDNAAFRRAFGRQDNARTLSYVFGRLYVLRNQMIHGGSTWNGKLNRDQVLHGEEILGFLVPVFVSLMLDNPEQEWGDPPYPPVEV